MTPSTIALIGNPNCGKTTLFNKLTGAKQKTGNWAGVTVDKKTGHYQFQNQSYHVVDLPGIYSSSVVSSASVDEKIAYHFLAKEGSVDLVINIVDAANLKRNLYLTLQLLEMQISCMLVINMKDVADKRGITIDTKQLAKLLKCDVVLLNDKKSDSINRLKSRIANFKPRNTGWKIHYPDIIEAPLAKLETRLAAQHNEIPKSRLRFYAIRLLEHDDAVREKFHHSELLAEAEQHIHTIERANNEDLDLLLADTRYQLAGDIIKQVISHQKSRRKTTTQWIDSIVTHRWIGIPIFLLLMYLMFELAMNVGSLLQPLFDISTNALFVNGIEHLGHLYHLPQWLITVVAYGIGLGINTVATFIPQIGIMFLFLSLLEDSGYMARAAFVMDRFMQYAGLPGKAFLPLILGFGCNVPSIMATRTLDTKRDRILTSMMAPFISCGARLAIFSVFASTFFPEQGGLVLFLLYVIGIIVALLTGLMLKKTLLTGKAQPFLIELPIYHVPSIRSISLLTWKRLKRFIFRAGKVIIPVCIIVGSLNHIHLPAQKNTSVNSPQYSILAYSGKAITPILHPMGIQAENWPATVGLLTGVLAKEVVIGTLNTLYTTNEQSKQRAPSFHLWSQLKLAVTETVNGFSSLFSLSHLNPFTANEAEHNISQNALNHMANAFASPYAAFAYLLFVLLYIPCISTMGVLAKEVGRSWAWGATAWSMNVAYCVSVIFYQTVSFYKHPISASAWIAGLLLLQTLIFYSLKRYANATGGKNVPLS